ncbi:unnamed protein product [Cuscuta campestris]|uniref:Uncharacterized protein n=1 Tax=Cuscuta campestris TaxID=132261 RepID=A0A484LLT7_9ASTE|nr:unnamed protein product [Cuscuta campestris]
MALNGRSTSSASLCTRHMKPLHLFDLNADYFCLSINFAYGVHDIAGVMTCHRFPCIHGLSHKRRDGLR